MRFRLLSGDAPGHPAIAACLLALLLALAFAPFLFPGTKALAVAARIAIFIVLAGSYDILLGYTGIVSFAHTVFFGLGAYGVAIPLARGHVSWGAIGLGLAAGVAISVALAALMALLGLRVRATFFSMITLAVASLAQVFASQFHDLTGGEDGLTFAVPRLLNPGFRLLEARIFGVRLDGRVLTYYLILAISLVLFLVMLRIVNSPFGRVLRAIRENPFRPEALGFRTIIHRTLASCIAAAIAAIAGGELALLLRYAGPAATLSLPIMVDVLLMVVIGGMGTLYGAALGATLIVIAEYYLQPLLRLLVSATRSLPVLPALLQSDRWLLWLGLLFIVVVRLAPQGIVGSLRARSGPARPDLGGGA